MPLADQLLAIGFVLCLACAAAWLLGRRRGLWTLWRPRAARDLEVLARLPLTGHHALHLVWVGRRTILVGTHPAGLVLSPAADAFPMELAAADRRLAHHGEER